MKTDTRQFLGWTARLRLLGRVLGMTGLFAALVGLFLWLALGRDVQVEPLRAALMETGTPQIAAYLLVAGLALTALILIFEVVGWFGGSGRRSATGANSFAQVALAIAILIGLNYFAFRAFKRWDLTRTKQFTLPTDVATELRKLEGKTTIVVLQRHKTFGQLSDKPDIYDFAAERKVVDKVRDLVDQFRLLGPQFRVVPLDVEAIGYNEQLEKETANRPGLKEAINAAPENSIFYFPDDRVERLTSTEAIRRATAGRRVHTQPITGDPNTVNAYEGNIPRLSFNEFYQLDKSASKADGGGRGNLVLRPQGIEAFARRILAIQEKRPKVGLLVIHEVLTSAPSTAGRDAFTASGLRKSLEDHGFDVVDVVVKKWGEQGGPTPAAYNVAETQYERLEAERDGLDEERRDLLDSRKDADEALKMFKEKSLAELTQLFRQQIRREFTEEFRQLQIRGVGDAVKQMNERLAELEVDYRDTDARLNALRRNERAFEDRRVTDVKAKLTRLVSDCDLVIVPRLTVLNASAVENIDPPFYRLSTDQVDVLKDFMKSGKPVMVCAGPNAEPNQPASQEPLDDLERLLADRGVQLGRETIITTAEAKGFAARRAGGQLGGASTDVPPITFPAAPATGRDNPIAAAMRATAASADMQLDLKLVNPRPVYVALGLENKTRFPGEFLLSPAASWNEENPMVMRNLGGGRAIVNPPRFKATPFGDPKKDTRDEVRRGPFPIGVAIESPVPVEWSEKEFGGQKGAAGLTALFDRGLSAIALTAAATGPKAERKTGRLVVIGHGGLFNGRELAPANEQLLLHSANWLLHRDERLPRTDAEWSYPRLQRDERDSFLWRYGPFLGLPALFLYLGLIVWIVRRVR